MKKIGHIHSDLSSVYIHQVNRYDELRSITPPSKRTVILLAGDAESISTDIIAQGADHLLDSGLAYICTWGPDCERVHDIFDQSYVGDGTTKPTADFMSTWHSSDTFAEAVEFFAMTAWPMDDACGDLSYLAIIIGSVRTEAAFVEAVTPYINQSK
jgi:hypothetical protein